MDPYGETMSTEKNVISPETSFDDAWDMFANADHEDDVKWEVPAEQETQDSVDPDSTTPDVLPEAKDTEQSEDTTKKDGDAATQEVMPEKADVIEGAEGKTEQAEPEVKETPDTNAAATTGHTLDYQKLYATKQQQFRSLEGRMAALAQERKDLLQKLQEAEEEVKRARAKTTRSNFSNFDDDYESFDNETTREGSLNHDVQKLIEEQVKKATKDLEDQVRSTQERERNATNRAHFEAIEKAHPELPAILDSGDLDVWVSTLPAVQQKAAMLIITGGTAPEVIDLVNQYKRDRRFNSTQSGKATQAATQNAAASATAPSIDYDEIVNRLKGAIAVPAGKTREVEPKPKNAIPEKYSDAWDYFAAQEEKRRRK